MSRFSLADYLRARLLKTCSLLFDSSFCSVDARFSREEARGGGVGLGRGVNLLRGIRSLSQKMRSLREVSGVWIILEWEQIS